MSTSPIDGAKKMINLKLKKPKAWNWELSTSKSSSSINFPKIRLYDHRNNLLATASESDAVISNAPSSLSKSTSKSSSVRSTRSNDAARKSPSLMHKRHEMQDFLNEITTQLNGRGYDCKVTNRSDERSWTRKLATTADDLRPTDECNQTSLRKSISTEVVAAATTTTTSPSPVFVVYSEKGLLQRDQNAKEFNRTKAKSYQRSATCNFEQVKQRISPSRITTQNAPSKKDSSYERGGAAKQQNFSMTKSKSAMDVVRENQNGKLDGKKKYRRTHSTSSSLRFSKSILERFSMLKRDAHTDSSSSSSSTQSDNLMEQTPGDGEKQSKYMLRTCPAGTLVVCKDSFLSYRGGRRRPRANKAAVHEEEAEIDVVTAITNDPIKSSSLRYDSAIANIDNLISKVISAEPSGGGGGGGGISSGTGDKERRRRLHWQDKVTMKSGGGGSSSSNHMDVNLMDKIQSSNRKEENAARLIKNIQLDQCNYVPSFRGEKCSAVDVSKKNSRKSSSNVGGGDCREKLKKNTKVRRRSASAGSDRLAAMSSSSSDEGSGMRERPSRGRQRTKVVNMRLQQKQHINGNEDNVERGK